jgi:hypothetical protein
MASDGTKTLGGGGKLSAQIRVDTIECLAAFGGDNNQSQVASVS